MNTLSDSELLLSSDEESSFRELYDRYWETLYTKALQRLNNDADAQDVVQEVFMSVWQHRKNISIEDTLAPYIFTALKYCIIKKIYRQANKDKAISKALSSLEHSNVSAAELLEYKELQEQVLREVEQLPLRMQQVYRLSRIDYQTITDIALQLGISEQTVKNTLSSALKKLRQQLTQQNSLLFFLL